MTAKKPPDKFEWSFNILISRIRVYGCSIQRFVLSAIYL